MCFSSRPLLFLARIAELLLAARLSLATEAFGHVLDLHAVGAIHILRQRCADPFTRPFNRTTVA